MPSVILVGSCLSHMNMGYHAAIRHTWGKQPHIAYYFLVGNSTMQPAHKMFRAEDTIVLPVPDDKEHLAAKMQAGIQWAKREGYGFVFCCWNDTYCFTPRMVRSNYAKFDYSGHFRGEEDNTGQGEKCNLGCYASGGSGYWLSPYASDFVANAGRPDHWADDLWVGKVMKEAGIRGTQDLRYFSAGGYTAECLTSHLSKGSNNYSTEWMWETHYEAMRRGQL